jgi:hypothetical protein
VPAGGDIKHKKPAWAIGLQGVERLINFQARCAVILECGDRLEMIAQQFFYDFGWLITK